MSGGNSLSDRGGGQEEEEEEEEELTGERVRGEVQKCERNVLEHRCVQLKFVKQRVSDNTMS